MLFQQRFHAGLKDGTIDLTFRRWQAAKVKVGGRYRFGADGALEVDAVDPVRVGDIRPAEARRAGFADVEALKDALSRGGSRCTARTRVYRVAFHPVARAAPAVAPDADPDELAARLERMDRLSRHGPWTGRVLALIADHPRTAASRLAPRTGRELRAFKADVRKLKKLGLTRSYEVGYALTPLGRRVLKRLS